MLTIIHNNVQTVQVNRISLDVISNIWSSIQYIKELVIYNVKLYPKFLQIIFIITFLSLLYIYEIKNKEPINFLKAIVIIIAFYISSLLLSIIYPYSIIKYNGRILGSIGAIISGIIIFLYTNTKIFEKNTYKKIGIVIVISYLVTILCNTWYVTHEFKKNNETDKELAIQIASEIEKYEQENNVEITKMAVNYIFDETHNEIPAMKQGQKFLGLFGPSEIELYTNKKLEKIIFEEDIKNQYFKQDEGDILCIDDTVYVQIKI